MSHLDGFVKDSLFRWVYSHFTGELEQNRIKNTMTDFIIRNPSVLSSEKCLMWSEIKDLAFREV